VENLDSAGIPQVTEEEIAASAAGAAKPSSKQIQQALKNAGFYNGKVDGDIGPKTKKSIEAFQAQNGLKADGKVGAKTWRALSAYLNKTTEVVNPTAEVQAGEQQ
jgi:peptidoglycan hydrolase-like protein with peptidoglycan-binding domain